MTADATVDTRTTTRALAPGKPLLRGWLHLVCFEAALVLGTLLIVTVPAGHRLAASIYAASVAALFGASALYHRGHWSPAKVHIFARLDHAMIFVLIGGSATPLLLIDLPRSVGLPMLLVFGTIIVAALVVHVIWIDAPERLVTATYITLGLMTGSALPGVLIHSGVVAFVLLLVGGVVYIVGAILFEGYRPDPRPDVFGYHEVWHCFVCVAAALHYIAIGALIL
jgi:hemolysin III